MLIYYLCAISGRQKYEVYFRRTATHLRKLKHQVLDDHVLGADPQQIEDLSADKHRERHKKAVGRLRRADLVVADVTHPTIELGYELGLASSMNVPILVLYQGDNIPYFLLGIDNPRFAVREYTDQDLEKVVEDSVKELLEERDIRFNFFISPQIGNYLDWLSKKERTPRAVFLRNMLDKKMDFDEEYKRVLNSGETDSSTSD